MKAYYNESTFEMPLFSLVPFCSSLRFMRAHENGYNECFLEYSEIIEYKNKVMFLKGAGWRSYFSFLAVTSIIVLQNSIPTGFRNDVVKLYSHCVSSFSPTYTM